MRKPFFSIVCLAVFSCLPFAGCHTEKSTSASASPSPTVTAAAPPAQEVNAPTVSVPANSVFRVKAGLDKPFTDSSGNVWQPDQGFVGGDVIDRDPSTAIANTTDAHLYLSEHYGMEAFACKIPNGKYTTKLHFAETFEGVQGAGDRVFSFDVQGKRFDDFDVWKKAGGANRAYIEVVPVEVTNGVFRINFTSKVENPEINAIEIIPAS